MQKRGDVLQNLLFQNSKGEIINFTNYAPFVFAEIKGLGSPEIQPTYNQAPTQYGYTLDNMLIDERQITLTCYVHGKINNETKLKKLFEFRRDLIKVLNPLLGLGTLIYTNDYGSYRIKGFLKNYSDLDKYNSISLQTIALTFECPTPFFESIEQSGVYLNYVEGGLEFPLVTPTDFGIFGYWVKIDNDSDLELPIEMYIDGGSINPIVKNETTGEFIKIEKPLEEHEKLYINTDPENIEVYIIRKDVETNKEIKENAYGYLTYDSTLFKLKQGINELTFNSDDEENKKVRIKIYYKKRWIGV